HSLRHSFITMLERAGVSPKTAQELARHSDIRLTMQRYTHKALHDLGAAVEAFPSVVPPHSPDRQALAATGTDGSSACTPACTTLAQVADRERERVIPNWTELLP